MPRENSFSDEGRSLTPDLSDEEDANGGAPPISPTYSRHAVLVEPAPPTAAHHNGHGANLFSSPSKQSIHSRRTLPRPTQAHALRGKARFRAVVRKVMFMKRGAHSLTRTGAGAEPGVDPRRETADLQYGHIRQNCVIELFDYSAIRNNSRIMTNKEFVNMMQDDMACQPEPWVKVRWINIAGVSWDVIKAVSLKYDLHPLALEDVFHSRSQTRSKVDYYSKHLFLRVVVHELGDPNEDPEITLAAPHGSNITGAPRSFSPQPMTAEDEESFELEAIKGSDFGDDGQTVVGTIPSRKAPSLRRRTRRSALKTSDPEKGSSIFKLNILDPEVIARKQAREEEIAIAALKRKGDSVNVKVYPIFIFLFRDGTIISMNSKPDASLTQPISHRLHHRDTVLRRSADPSFLVQSLLDLSVDKTLEVIDEYHAKIQKFERQILVQPKITTVRALHILNEDLILHKRTMEPIKTVVYGLRRYDLDRSAALLESKDPNVKVVGYMSHKSKIYLADVYDHIEYSLSSLDMFADISQNLIDYTFNITSYDMNQDMRRLTLATIIFLPLTLLTGYFGMNFQFMWSVNKHSDLLFWEIALPVMAVVIPLFLMPDLRRMAHYVHKRVIAKKAIKIYKQA